MSPSALSILCSAAYRPRSSRAEHVHGYRRSYSGTGRQWLSVAAAVALLATSFGGLLLWHSQTLQLLSVQTGSMRPLLQPGDAVLVRRIPASELRPGDVVSFRSPADNRITVTHRVLTVDNVAGVAMTKGDANRSADSPVPSDDVLGRVERRFAKLGYLIDMLHGPAGLLLGVYLPAALLVVGELRRLTAYFRPAYRHPTTV